MNARQRFSIPDHGTAWVCLMGLTMAIFALCELVHLPAAPLLAGIASGSFLALRNTAIAVPPPLFECSQCVLGLMISRTFTVEVLHGVLDNWIMAIVIVVAVVLFGLAGGLTITVKQWLPGTTGIWGISPGGATAMTVMSHAYGGDMRLVAIMQYLRVMIVVFVAVGVARVLEPAKVLQGGPSYFSSLFPPVDGVAFALTLVVAVVCCWGARLSRIPAAFFLLPMFVGAVCNNTGAVSIELPRWLLVLVSICIGWSIGLRFKRDVFIYAWKALPKILGAIFFMVGSAGILAVILVYGWDIDPMTAFLATSPGGADAVAIIAASSGGDMVFIMAVQTLRLLVVMLAGPYLARTAAGIAAKRIPSGR